MNDLDDFELNADGAGAQASKPGSGGGRGSGLITGGIVFAILVGATIWILKTYSPPSTPHPTPDFRHVSRTPSPSPSPTPMPAIPLPALDQSDELVRSLTGGLSTHPQLGLWLAQKNLIRRFTAVIENVARGESPRPHLHFLVIKGEFGAMKEHGRIVIDPSSHIRYDFVADAVESLDAAGCAGVYQLLLPLGESAYRELGHPQGGLTQAVERAFRHLLDAPVIPGRIELKPIVRGNLVLYEYAEPDLEKLSPAKKHLLRMGPKNVGRIQAKLGELAEALGLPVAGKSAQHEQP
ncbi:MAG: DUF3014 domain-containing protein [Vicinamibacteria bacterium]|nr:DUF3014 domain-containing protein [Vicinamibacteria bacterium]